MQNQNLATNPNMFEFNNGKLGGEENKRKYEYQMQKKLF